jgi:hypothetical protein
MSATHMRERRRKEKHVMTIPGFTAEASVYQLRRTYNSVALSVTPNLQHYVSPQQQGLFGLSPWFRRTPDCGPDGILICNRFGCWCA